MFGSDDEEDDHSSLFADLADLARSDAGGGGRPFGDPGTLVHGGAETDAVRFHRSDVSSLKREADDGASFVAADRRTSKRSRAPIDGDDEALATTATASVRIPEAAVITRGPGARGWPEQRDVIIATSHVEADQVHAARRRVVLHVDVDCFYCQVEALDDATLRGKPLAVTQHNRGGFVAVSYEAKARGVRKGDGVGAGGRANIEHLKRMGARSEAEARASCPDLIVRPMRTSRYREVGERILSVITETLGAACAAAEKASCDDFYVELRPSTSSPEESFPDPDRSTRITLASRRGPSGTPSTVTAGDDEGDDRAGDARRHPSSTHLGDADASASATKTVAETLRRAGVAEDLIRGVAAADALRSALRSIVGVTVGVAVARGPLIARLIGRLAKPDGVAVLADDDAVGYLRRCKLSDLPSLGGARGRAAAAALGSEDVTLGDAVDVGAAALCAALEGAGHGANAVRSVSAIIRDLAVAEDRSPVIPRGPPKSLLAEISFPPVVTLEASFERCDVLAAQLWTRLVEDAATHAAHRLDPIGSPRRITLTWRCGFQTGVRSRSAPVPVDVVAALRAEYVAAKRTTRKEEAAADFSATRNKFSSEKGYAGKAEGRAALARGFRALVADVAAEAGDAWRLNRLALAVGFTSGGGRDAAASRRNTSCTAASSASHRGGGAGRTASLDAFVVRRPRAV